MISRYLTFPLLSPLQFLYLYASRRLFHLSLVFHDSFVLDLTRSSVEVPLVTHHLPLDKVFQFVGIRNHVLVVLDLLVGLDDAQVDSSQIDLS